MEVIKFNLNYRGASLEVKVYPDENCFGQIYAIEVDGSYIFTLNMTESNELILMKENDGNIPAVEIDLFAKLIKKLKWQLRYVT